MIIQLARTTPNPWYRLSDDERRAAWMHEARRRGGVIRSQQPSMSAARSKGYWALLHKNPQALFYVKKRLKVWNQQHADAHNLPYDEWRLQRFRHLRITYKNLEREGGAGHAS